MSETSTEETAAPAAATGEAPTLQGLADKVDQLASTVGGLIDRLHGDAARHEETKLSRPTRAADTTREHAASLTEEIQAELARLKQQETADKEHADMKARVSRVERAVEKKPREHRRIHYAMGWVRDGDE